MNRLRFSIWHFVLHWLVGGGGVEKREAFDGHLVGGPSLCTLSAFTLLVLTSLHVPPAPRPKKRGPLHHHMLSKAFIIKWWWGGVLEIVIWAAVITGVPP